MVAQTAAKFPEVKISHDVKEKYKNMKEVLKNNPELTNNTMEAAKRAGLKPFLKPIRGGTDGSRLTFQGLPTPNLFTGGGNFHGKLEYNSRRGLEKSTETLLNLVQIFAEKSEPPINADERRSAFIRENPRLKMTMNSGYVALIGR